jgi:hypothetical protein
MQHLLQKKINTRSQFKDVPGIEELLNNNDITSKKLSKQQISLFSSETHDDSSNKSNYKDYNYKKDVTSINKSSKKQINQTHIYKCQLKILHYFLKA